MEMQWFIITRLSKNFIFLVMSKFAKISVFYSDGHYYIIIKTQDKVKILQFFIVKSNWSRVTVKSI